MFTSYDVSNSCCGPQRKHFGRTPCPLAFVVIALSFSELRVRRRAESPPPRQVPEDRKTVGLNGLEREFKVFTDVQRLIFP